MASGVDALPKTVALDGDACLGFARAANIGYGLEAEDAEGIGVFEKPAGDFGDVFEVAGGDGVGGGGFEGDARLLAYPADELGEGLADGVEL